jgi:oxygen-dependent protoporphyrinogen oxidase
VIQSRDRAGLASAGAVAHDEPRAEPAPPPLRVVVVGGGIAGLACAHRLLAAGGGRVGCTVVEAAPRPGGKVVTDRVEGFVVEGGPDAFLTAKPAALALAGELGLGDRLVPASGGGRRVAIFHRGRLVPVPDGVGLLAPARWRPLLASPLLSPLGKLRMAAERWVPPRTEPGDESLASFVRRRFGRQALERLAEPLMAHIHLADPERLSLAAAFPRLAAMERRHGSLRRAVAAARAVGGGVRGGRKKELGREEGGGSAGDRAGRAIHGELGGAFGGREELPPFLTPLGGMDELIEALAARIVAAGGELLVGRSVAAVRSGGASTGGGGSAAGRRWTVALDDGTRLAADAVVLAVPAFAAAGLVEGAAPELAAALGEIRYVSAATVSLAYRREALARPPEGFGFFVPRRAGRRIVAATWTSNKLAGRAPAGAVLVRAFVGGAGAERLAELPEADLVELARTELAEIAGLEAPPILARVHRWPRGYPQYDVGHLDRVARLAALAPPGLLLAGSAYHGVGIPDCVASGRAAAEAALALAEALIP